MLFRKHGAGGRACAHLANVLLPSGLPSHSIGVFILEEVCSHIKWKEPSKEKSLATEENGEARTLRQRLGCRLDSGVFLLLRWKGRVKN